MYLYLYFGIRLNMKFYFFDLDLDPMTLVLKLDNIKMYVCTENKVPSFSGSKCIA